MTGYNPSTWEAEASGHSSRQPVLHSQFQASQGYMTNPPKKQQQQKDQKKHEAEDPAGNLTQSL